MTARRSWWRENRLWLAALPVALAAIVAASSYNLSFWFDSGLHREVASASPGEVLRTTLDYDDALGPTSRTFQVRLAAVRTTDADYPYQFEDPAPPPDGVDAVSVHLQWRAEPDQVLNGCKVALVDEQGRRYEVDGSAFPWACVPEDRAGPDDPLEGGKRGVVPEGAERPPSWTTSPVVLVPHGRRITRVLVWWERPDYVTLSVS
jgi:hypothetical protein